MTHTHAHTLMLLLDYLSLQLKKRDALRMLSVSYFGNFAGTALMVGLFYAAGTYEGKDEYLIYSAEQKVRLGF